jgi:N-acetylmuramoyl-L-alanine amidase
VYVRPPVRPPPPKPTRRRVLLDPGHGGKDPGATSCLGFHEKVVNLAVAREVARGLTARGVDASLTRDDDRFIELNDRAARADKVRADVFVSIHADHCPRPSVRGFSVYVARDAAKPSLDLAAAVVAALARTGMQGRGVRKADFRVLVRTRCPAVLVELGYLSNPRDSVLLADGRFQKRLAAAVADGVAAYLAKR